jgi:hypothetical protein
MGIKQCARCKVGRYCSADCQRAAWPKHQQFCKPELAALLTREKQTVRVVVYDGTRAHYREVDILMFAEVLNHAELAPIANRVGEPIAVYHVDHKYGGADNIQACFHMVNLESGIAPAKWQSRVGRVWFMRTDGQDHSSHDVAFMYEYCYYTMAYYEDTSAQEAASRITRADWLRYSQRLTEWMNMKDAKDTGSPG